MEGDFEMDSNPDIQERRMLDLALEQKKPIEFQCTAVSCVNECSSKYAEKLCIFELSYKFDNPDEYDIGGSYTDGKPDLWFYMTTSACPGDNYLLNLFICQRNIGFVTLGISKSNMLKTEMKYENYTFMSEELTWKTFKSSKRDQCQYIKTFTFKKTWIKTLIVPIRIKICSSFQLNNEIVERIQTTHNIGSILKKGNTDFILETASHKKYEAHKIVLCTHSPVLKDMIKKSNVNNLFFDITDQEMDLLLEYLYTGNIKEINKQDKVMLLELVQKFELKKLFTLVEQAIKDQIAVQNALDIAKLSQKYNLKEVEKQVFKFVKENPQVLETEAWKNLNDITLTKKLFEHIYFENYT
ncbi:uncharacterized protein LOC123704439 [Colias croceus]|uniref:uncharacterized protein LOC123704439 n=1 Tax=Colias crocea TaxID=72248 RepID=UPI001E27A77C|nr:uncharacterized protein LOC123704439 [Colias croceus]XP_045508794.1 uncharacterized protein LOC123704439 [Colias croceus]